MSKLTIEEFFGRTDVERKLVAGDEVQFEIDGYVWKLITYDYDGMFVLLNVKYNVIHHKRELQSNYCDNVSVKKLNEYYEDTICTINGDNVFNVYTPKKLKVGMHVFERGNEYIISSYDKHTVAAIDLANGHLFGYLTKVSNVDDISKHEFLKMFGTDATIMC